METIILVLIFTSGVIGAIVGSFLNVVILRGAREEPLGGRSRCESCRKTLSPLELIPIVSFFIQRGRCRNCGSRLFWQYPAVELGTTLAFASVSLFFLQNNPLNLNVFLWILAAMLAVSAAVVILVSDVKFYLIPNGAVLSLLLVGVFVNGSGNFGKLNVYDLGIALFFSSIPAFLWLISKGKWMGFGDAKLFFVTSLIAGFPKAIAAFLFSFWTAALFGAVMLASGKKSLKGRLAFAPFILLGTLLSLLFGQKFLGLIGFSELLRLML